MLHIASQYLTYHKIAKTPKQAALHHHVILQNSKASLAQPDPLPNASLHLVKSLEMFGKGSRCACETTDIAVVYGSRVHFCNKTRQTLPPLLMNPIGNKDDSLGMPSN